MLDSEKNQKITGLTSTNWEVFTAFLSTGWNYRGFPALGWEVQPLFCNVKFSGKLNTGIFDGEKMKT